MSKDVIMNKGTTINLLINNEEVETARYREVRDPGKLTDIVGVTAVGTEKHVDQAVRAAHEAYKKWRKTDVEKRCKLLLKAADILDKEATQYDSLLSREAGILLPHSKGELAGLGASIRSTVELAKDFYQPFTKEDEGGRLYVEKNPLGVVAALTPWNAPIVIAIMKLTPVILTGNTVVIKPSPHASMAVTKVLHKIISLFPPGVINVVHGDAEVGKALTSHPLVRKITLTGGGQTARHVMTNAAQSIKKVHFELGGNDPAIVLDDANLEEVIPKIVRAAFMRSGQICVAVKRVYIPEKLYKDACDLAINCVDQFKIGHSLHPDTTLGPVNNEAQYNFVKQLIKKTKESNASVMELGDKLEPNNWDSGYYIQPTLVINPSHEQEVVTSEQFGPLLPIISYKTEEEAIFHANNTELGLGSTVWTSDEERALSVAREIEAGMTWVNGFGSTSAGRQHSPIGGVKQSGIGRERTEYGLLEFVDFHVIDIHKK